MVWFLMKLENNSSFDSWEKDGKKIFPKIFPKIFWMVFSGAFSHFAFLIPWVVGLMEFSDVTK